MFLHKLSKVIKPVGNCFIWPSFWRHRIHANEGVVHYEIVFVYHTSCCYRILVMFWYWNFFWYNWWCKYHTSCCYRILVIIQVFGTIDCVDIASVLCQDSNMKLIIDYNFQYTMFGFISYSKRERCLFGRTSIGHLVAALTSFWILLHTQTTELSFLAECGLWFE